MPIGALIHYIIDVRANGAHRGRVGLVYEDPLGANLLTQYTYDALGDLTGVAKCSASGCGSGQQVRTFSYDSLGRLTQATNPESGLFTYSYVGSGGAARTLQSRTDPRGALTNYSYDALYRSTAVSYSDGSAALSYSYD
jgi:YD repeat-containing protein